MNDQYDFERYIPALKRAARRYANYFNNDQSEAFSLFSLKVYEFILKRQAMNLAVNEALVCTVCANAATDYYRKENAIKRSFNRNIQNSDEVNEIAAIEQTFDDHEYLALIKERAFSIATQQQKELIELRLSNAELTYTAIAEKLDVDISTVTRRAKSLRKRYEKTFGSIA